ncbi:hypothetical protein Daudx_1203 [Candidatus Desulforudis audaxviator]|nr:hypothetical protein Daudx_1203 [Candidatus Desulforudis audaxviator]
MASAVTGPRGMTALPNGGLVTTDWETQTQIEKVDCRNRA